MSNLKRLMATTTGTPNLWVFSMCLPRFAHPNAVACGSSFLGGYGGHVG